MGERSEHLVWFTDRAGAAPRQTEVSTGAGSFSNPVPFCKRHIDNASGEKPEVKKSCQVPSGSLSLWAPHFPLSGISKGAETSAKRVLRNDQFREGVCKDFTYKIEKNCQYQKVEILDGELKVPPSHC